MGNISTGSTPPPADKWPLVRQLMTNERQPFFTELRNERPVMDLPDGIVFVTRHPDCTMVLQRWNDFGVDLYKPKQGGFRVSQFNIERILHAFLPHQIPKRFR